MSEQHSSDEDSLPLWTVERIDHRCTQFEEAWKTGARPSLTEYLKGVEDVERNVLLKELLFVDIAYRQRLHETPQPEDYARLLDAGPIIEMVFCELFPNVADATTDLSDDNSVAGNRERRMLSAAEIPPCGRYKPTEVLGKGAFGTVYLADDEQLSRLVAVKVLHADWLKSDSARAAFDRESKLAANLKHPSIVTVHDVGHTPTGDPYFVMEYVKGQRLDKRLRASAIPPDRTVDLLIQVADAVDYAHRNGLVHRDIKPANILLDEQGVPHVSDFGLALQKDRQRLHVGEISGTAAYMSPEQVRGDSHQLDGRSDVWGLGVVMYEMLTGQRPFQGETRDTVFDEILNCDPPPPMEMAPAIAAELQAICLKCLQKDLSSRYSTAGELAQSLRKVSTRRTKSDVARRSFAVGVVAVLVVAGLLLWWSTDRLRRGDAPDTFSFTVSSTGEPFTSLSAAVAAAQDGDTIEVRGNGVFPSPRIETARKALRIKAVPGCSPTIALSDTEATELLFAAAPLVLEGITFQRVSNQQQTSLLAVSESQGALYAINCRFVLEGPERCSCIEGEALDHCELINCELYSAGAAAIRWSPRNGKLRIENCVHQGHTFLNVGPLKDEFCSGTVEIVRSTVFADRATQSFIPRRISRRVPNQPRFRYSVSDSVARVDSVFNFVVIAFPPANETDRAVISDWVTWQEKQNLYAVRESFLGNSNIGELDSWHNFWGIMNTGSRQVPPETIVDTIPSDPKQVRPKHFQVDVGSREIGASLNHVGPEAYAEWSTTTAYDQWLKRVLQHLDDDSS